MKSEFKNILLPGDKTCFSVRYSYYIIIIKMLEQCSDCSFCLFLQVNGKQRFLVKQTKLTNKVQFLKVDFKKLSPF